MEGNGPTAGTPVEMGLILAGTSPLATDMVGASLMGFKTDEIPTFRVAHQLKMEPMSLNEIEIRGLALEEVRRPFIKPDLVTWTDFGYKEI